MQIVSKTLCGDHFMNKNSSRRLYAYLHVFLRIASIDLHVFLRINQCRHAYLHVFLRIYRQKLPKMGPRMDPPIDTRSSKTRLFTYKSACMCRFTCVFTCKVDQKSPKIEISKHILTGCSYTRKNTYKQSARLTFIRVFTCKIAYRRPLYDPSDKRFIRVFTCKMH